MDIITKAQQTAQQLHLLQKRKSGGLPYFTHLQKVAQIVSEYTTDPELISAAYLHDTIEDTAYTPDKLKQAFGERIHALVLSVTKESEDIEDYLAGINTPDSLLIAGADKLANSTDMTEVTDWIVFQFTPAEKIKRYREVAQRVRSSWPALADRIETQLSRVEKQIENPQ